MDSGENLKPKIDFKSLGNKEKVVAVLGAVEEPVSRDLVLDFSGIDYDRLKQEEKIEVNSAFNEIGVDKTQSEEGEKYILNSEGRLKIDKHIDMTTVHGAIADVLMEWWEETKEDFS